MEREGQGFKKRGRLELDEDLLLRSGTDSPKRVQLVNLLAACKHFVKCFIEALNCSAWVSRDSTLLCSCDVVIRRVTSSILEQIPFTDTT